MTGNCTICLLNLENTSIYEDSIKLLYDYNNEKTEKINTKDDERGKKHERSQSDDFSLFSLQRDWISDTFESKIDKEQQLAKLMVATSCKHYFHASCLTAWCEISSTCPTCRAKILKVYAFRNDISKDLGNAQSSDCSESKLIIKYSVKEATAVHQMDEVETLALVDTFNCQICRDSNREDVLLLCDSCNDAYHTYCVDMDKVPQGPFFCPTCAPLNPQVSVDIAKKSNNQARRTIQILRQSLAQSRRSLYGASCWDLEEEAQPSSRSQDKIRKEMREKREWGNKISEIQRHNKRKMYREAQQQSENDAFETGDHFVWKLRDEAVKVCKENYKLDTLAKITEPKLDAKNTKRLRRPSSTSRCLEVNFIEKPSQTEQEPSEVGSKSVLAELLGEIKHSDI